MASTVRANCTKMAVAVNTIVDDMHAELVNKLKTGWWSIIIDESADISVKEQVSVSGWLFDESSGKVQTLSIGVVSIVSCYYENIFESISNFLSKDRLDWSR